MTDVGDIEDKEDKESTRNIESLKINIGFGSFCFIHPKYCSVLHLLNIKNIYQFSIQSLAGGSCCLLDCGPMFTVYSLMEKCQRKVPAPTLKNKKRKLLKIF